MFQPLREIICDQAKDLKSYYDQRQSRTVRWNEVLRDLVEYEKPVAEMTRKGYKYLYQSPMDPNNQRFIPARSLWRSGRDIKFQGLVKAVLN